MKPIHDSPSAAQVAVHNDCWNRIGVRGDASCPELKQHIHCRNCPVYAAAAARLLDADAPADYLDHWTRQIAQPTSLTQQNSLSALIFRIGAEWLALPARVLSEIASLRAVHAIPHRRDGVVTGLTNIRGELLVCVSLARILGVEAGASGDSGTQPAVAARLLVLQRDGHRAVCSVDQIHGIERYRPQELTSAPATVAKAAARYTQAVLTWQRKSVGLLDDEVLFDSIARGLA
jgi:chemotaxis-related protein WspD